ncbi:MAG: hypothetical protein A3K19_18110 [Lentisphaerae bacterium RIFOXYB12_FULL_65_16]|nr:MAG: hypothetical protein A3K18_12575 [Lentisphaerae bacterium RIFOXYA12_64_32]OGV87104.1 MAG: hypothetical protein A3K19_18110 [Lentisphaerae bacterium RIFOXYB12_FULL_65_16]
MTAPLRICVNTRTLAAPLTGVQRYVRELLRHIGDRIETVAPARALFGIRGHLWDQCKLPGLVRGRLLWSPGNTGPLACRRQVVTVHDLAPIHHPEWFSPAFAAWYRWVLPRLVRRCQHVIAVSEFTRRSLVEATGVPADRMSVVYSGIDERFQPQPPEAVAAVRQALGIPVPGYLLYLGSLEPRKNIPRLLQAWAKATGAVSSQVCLVVAGAKGQTRIFREVHLGGLPPSVHLTGRIGDEQLPALLSGAMAFVYPSLYEGFGLPPLEAMACGVPVLAGNRTAFPEVLGDAALLVDTEDTDAIAQALVRLIQDPDMRRSLGRKGEDRARRFRWPEAAEKTWAVLQQASESQP